MAPAPAPSPSLSYFRLTNTAQRLFHKRKAHNQIFEKPIKVDLRYEWKNICFLQSTQTPTGIFDNTN